jgi:hypothetical protein
MIRIFCSLVISIIFTINIYADVKIESIKEYIDISKGGEMLRDNQYDALLKLCILSDMNISTISPKVLGVMKKATEHPKYMNKFMLEFENISEDTFNKIIKFWKTRLGKKYFESYKKILGYNSKIKIKNLYTNLSSTNKYSKQKSQLIKDIYEVLNLFERKFESSYKIHHSFNSFTPKSTQYSQEEMTKFANAYKIKLMDYDQKFYWLIYFDFTEKELETILEYSLSNAGQTEIKSMYDGLLAYRISIMKDIMIEFRKDLNKTKTNKKKVY